MPTVRAWIAICAFVALILIPICWRFWKGWDRPSRAARKEMKRRIQERDIRETFLREDAKAREEQRLEAQRELARKKAQAPPPVESSILEKAFGNLGEEGGAKAQNVDRTGTEILAESRGIRREIPQSSEDVTDLVDSLDIDDIKDDAIIPEVTPVAVQLQGTSGKEMKGNAGADDVTWGSNDPDDDWSDIGWR